MELLQKNNMDLLTKNMIPFTWKLACAGIKYFSLSPNDVAIAAFEGRFKEKVPEELLIELELRKDDDSKSFLEFVESLIVGSHDDYEKEVRIWRLLYLNEIKSKNISINEKLNQIENLWARFHYPDEWRSFIYYLPPTSPKINSEESVYQVFLDFYKKEQLELLS